MKKLLLTICALALLTSSNAQTLNRSTRPQPGPAPKINLAEPATFTLPNGLKVFVVENHKMPIVTYSIQLDIRPELEGDKVGIHSFAGQLLTRGTTTRSKEEFDKAVDQIGASISASSSSMSGISLSKYQDSLLTLMSDALLHPAFEQEQLEKVEKQTESGLIANENDPDNMLSNVSGVVNFGRNHPYGEVTTLQSIRKVTLEDIKNYYNTYFRPNVAYLAVVGDVTPETAKKLVTKYFGSWEKGNVPRTTYPKVTTPDQRTIDYVERPGAVQSVMAITYPVDLQIGSPEVMKVQAMNQILGGGSTGRLFQNLRERHGWTYGSYSSVSPDDIIGSVKLYAKARNVVTDSSISEMIKEMDTIRNIPVSQETLNGVKNYMSGIFALRLESPQTIAQYAINIDRYHMPKDYYKNYLKNVATVNTTEVQEMAKKYILPERAHIIVVGNPSEAGKVKKFSPDGKINYYDGYGNPIKAATEKEVNGKKISDVMDMYINALGGKEAIEGLKDLTEFADLKMRNTVVAKVNILISTPDKYLQKTTQSAPNNSAAAPAPGLDALSETGSPASHTQKTVINGDAGYMQAGNNKIDLKGNELKSYQAEADLQSLLHPEKYGISYALVSMAQVDGSPAYEVSKASNDGKDKAILFIDAQSGFLVKKIENEKHGGQSVLTTKLYSDYGAVKNGNGYKVPFKITINTPNGEQIIQVRNAKANSGINDKRFR